MSKTDYVPRISQLDSESLDLALCEALTERLGQAFQHFRRWEHCTALGAGS